MKNNHSLNAKVNFTSFNSLRAIAAGAVVFFHVAKKVNSPDTEFYRELKYFIGFGKNGGNLGVVFFFILSGFLITYLLLLEKDANHRFSLVTFYVKRILRIWPAYFLTLIVGFVLYPLLSGHPESISSPVLYSLFLANYDNIHNGFSDNGILGVQWSVAIEMQFYLFWPILLLLVKSKRLLLITIICLIGFSEFYTFSLSDFYSGYFHLFGCVRYLAWGGLLAILCYTRSEIIIKGLNMIPTGIVLLIYIFSISLLYFYPQFIQIWQPSQYFMELLTLLFFGFVILEQEYSVNSFWKIGRVKILNKIGEISYGVYLYHMIAIHFISYSFISVGIDNFFVRTLFIVLTTLLLSYVSYQFVERFFLRLKSKIKF